MKKRAAIAAAVLGTVAAVVSTREPTAPMEHTCVRAPLDGGTDCLCVGAGFHGEPRYIGAGNVCRTGGLGAQCEETPCSVRFGGQR